MEIHWDYPENPDENLTAHVLKVRRVSALIPMSAEQLLDAGIPLPPGMAAPARPAPLSRRVRWRMARATLIRSVRQRIGFWIAGYEPRDDDWDW